MSRPEKAGYNGFLSCVYLQCSHAGPSKHKHLHNICTAPAQRLRRWSNILQMFYKCFVLTGEAIILQADPCQSFAPGSLKARLITFCLAVIAW